MQFENKGKWLKESEDKSDYLDENDDELLDDIEEDDFEEIDNSINESFGPDDIVPQSKQLEFKKQYLQGKDARKVNKNSFYFDGIHAVDDNTGTDIKGAVLGMKYKDLAAALDKFFGESAQMNETRGYTVTVELGVPDNMNNRDIEDEVEKLLRASHKINVVMDVTAERK